MNLISLLISVSALAAPCHDGQKCEMKSHEFVAAAVESKQSPVVFKATSGHTILCDCLRRDLNTTLKKKSSGSELVWSISHEDAQGRKDEADRGFNGLPSVEACKANVAKIKSEIDAGRKVKFEVDASGLKIFASNGVNLLADSLESKLELQNDIYGPAKSRSVKSAGDASEEELNTGAQ
ncbi:MAG: hypothetical protein ACXWQO_16460 [Bdellovibrionota bacterium]